MRSPVQAISFVVAGEVEEGGEEGLAIQRTVRAAFVWQSSERKGGSTMRWSMEAFRCAFAGGQVSIVIEGDRGGEGEGFCVPGSLIGAIKS